MRQDFLLTIPARNSVLTPNSGILHHTWKSGHVYKAGYMQNCYNRPHFGYSILLTSTRNTFCVPEKLKCNLSEHAPMFIHGNIPSAPTRLVVVDQSKSLMVEHLDLLQTIMLVYCLKTMRYSGSVQTGWDKKNPQCGECTEIVSSLGSKEV